MPIKNAVRELLEIQPPENGQNGSHGSQRGAAAGKKQLARYVKCGNTYDAIF
jgi:hypothetical protein